MKVGTATSEMRGSPRQSRGGLGSLSAESSLKSPRPSPEPALLRGADVQEVDDDGGDRCDIEHVSEVNRWLCEARRSETRRPGPGRISRPSRPKPPAHFPDSFCLITSERDTTARMGAETPRRTSTSMAPSMSVTKGTKQVGGRRHGRAGEDQAVRADPVEEDAPEDLGDQEAGPEEAR